MPVSVSEVGIQQIEDFTLLTECEVELGLQETEPCLKYNGELDDDAAEVFNPVYEFSFKGKGDLPAGLALASDGGFSHESFGTQGVTKILRVKDAEQTDRLNDWECSGKNCPNAA